MKYAIKVFFKDPPSQIIQLNKQFEILSEAEDYLVNELDYYPGFVRSNNQFIPLHRIFKIEIVETEK